MASTRLKLRLTTTAEKIIRSGHPWLFSDSIKEQNREGEVGELAVIYDKQNRFMAAGFFDPKSPIRVRIVHVGEPVTVDETFWRKRFEEARAKRAPLFDAQTNGYRVINGESDGFPGLVVDRYDGTFVMKIYTAIWFGLIPMFQQFFAGSNLVLRLSRNIQAGARFSDGQVLNGQVGERVEFLESGLRFEAEVLRGQKTGFFLDQRENRRQVEKLAQGKRVLNAFSFSGGFSLYAARGGAASVTDLDISDHALDSSRRNFKLNPGLAKTNHLCVKADAFEWLENEKAGQFDLIVIDPPTLAKREQQKTAALSGYANLMRSGVRLLSRGGTLVLASCTAHVTSEEFFELARHVTQSSGRAFREFLTTGHAPDHPALIPEAAYLKCIYFKEV